MAPLLVILGLGAFGAVLGTAMASLTAGATGILIKAVCKSAVTKGQLIKWDAHTGGNVGSVSTADAGGAMKTGRKDAIISI